MIPLVFFPTPIVIVYYMYYSDCSSVILIPIISFLKSFVFLFLYLTIVLLLLCDCSFWNLNYFILNFYILIPYPKPCFHFLFFSRFCFMISYVVLSARSRSTHHYRTV
ncbi:hypothetical protein L873DRAFT_377646 [Choiromyces venosus 120613-1]|uniref:Uncharacterized protein n=1 Tax=Choiromyces venosus 120613-1 TaxID=1336337 RepID=A0A3N4IXV2_9PEZI|nr:hypothetical protein L873DRAFT_377646 [Choiromyces venosus 120613-1]